MKETQPLKSAIKLRKNSVLPVTFHTPPETIDQYSSDLTSDHKFTLCRTEDVYSWTKWPFYGKLILLYSSLLETVPIFDIEEPMIIYLHVYNKDSAECILTWMAFGGIYVIIYWSFWYKCGVIDVNRGTLILLCIYVRQSSKH